MQLAGPLPEPVRRPGVGHVDGGVTHRVVPLPGPAHDGPGALGHGDARVVHDVADVEAEPLVAVAGEQLTPDGAGAVADAAAAEGLQQPGAGAWLGGRPGVDRGPQPLLAERAAVGGVQRRRDDQPHPASVVAQPHRQPVADQLVGPVVGGRGEGGGQRPPVRRGQLELVAPGRQQHRVAEQVGAQREVGGLAPVGCFRGGPSRLALAAARPHPERPVRGQPQPVPHEAGAAQHHVGGPDRVGAVHQVLRRAVPDPDGDQPRPVTGDVVGQRRLEAAVAAVLVRTRRPLVQGRVVDRADVDRPGARAAPVADRHLEVRPTGLVLDERGAVEQQRAGGVVPQAHPGAQPAVDVLDASPGRRRCDAQPRWQRGERDVLDGPDRQAVRVVGEVVLQQRQVVTLAVGRGPRRQPLGQRHPGEHLGRHVVDEAGHPVAQGVDPGTRVAERVDVQRREEVGQQALLPGPQQRRRLGGPDVTDPGEHGEPVRQHLGPEPVLHVHRQRHLPVVALVDDRVDARHPVGGGEHPGDRDRGVEPRGHRGRHRAPVVEPEQLAGGCDVRGEVEAVDAAAAVADHVDLDPQDDVRALLLGGLDQPLETAVGDRVVHVDEGEVATGRGGHRGVEPGRVVGSRDQELGAAQRGACLVEPGVVTADREHHAHPRLPAAPEEAAHTVTK